MLEWGLELEQCVNERVNVAKICGTCNGPDFDHPMRCCVQGRWLGSNESLELVKLVVREMNQYNQKLGGDAVRKHYEGATTNTGTGELIKKFIQVNQD